MKNSAEIRQMFQDFFKSQGHAVVASSSLVPHNDPTLLFTNAGMNQFKEVFLGMEKRDYVRATTAQRCVRAGGKHNDLDNVGYTARHHTFFEMLGNFSFGDYFKREAITFAWTLLTDPEWFNIPKDRLLVTVYASDDEAYNIWLNEIGIAPEKIIRIGDNKGAPYASDNFWQMGDTGPCGPCTEIFYDHGDHLWGGPPGSPEEDGDRFIEIWNIVFMQFNRQANGEMLPLPKPSVDTGMGLERIAAVLQHVHSNYEIDLFQKLIDRVATLLQVTDKENKSLRVIADHIRACAFLIADGVMPSNEGRGYVLRRIIRRAVRHGHLLGANDIFFYQLVQPLIDVMASAGEVVSEQQHLVEETLKAEEVQFRNTLERGMSLLNQTLSALQGTVLAGDVAFKLYDTYGFPLDLTADVCREHNVTIDEIGFERAMNEQRQRSREGDHFKTDYSAAIHLDSKTEFLGYDSNESSATLVAIYRDGQAVSEAEASSEHDLILILNQTPFYGESGGQRGDKGVISIGQTRFEVIDCQKYGDNIGHIGQLIEGSLQVGQQVTASIDTQLRGQVKRNHSATHLLQAALKKVLGDHVQQRGSLVNESYLRFDFSHNQAISQEQLYQVENLVNAAIRENNPVLAELMPIDEAKKRGAMALFGEKYGDTVRVLTMGDFSMELCGGTHVTRTGDIGLFKIISEGSVASGIRRIEATTGQNALTLIQNYEAQLYALSTQFKCDKLSTFEKVEQLLNHQKTLEKQLSELKSKLTANAAADLMDKVIRVNQYAVLAVVMDNIDSKTLRTMVDDLKNRLQQGIVMIASIVDGKVSLAVGVTPTLTSQFKAGDIVADLAQQLGGKGGGRPDFAQAGAKEVDNVESVLYTKRESLLTLLQQIS